MAISLRSARSLVVGDVSLEGDVIVFQGSTNTYNITDFNSFSEYSVSSDYGSASISGDVITLTIPTPATQNQIKLTVIKDSKSSVFTVAVGASVVNTPSITSPVNGATGVALQPTIEASAFSTTPPAQGVHQSSQWQVATSADFLNIAYDSGVDTVNKTSITIPSPLSLNTQHLARVRYTSSTIGTSDWSAAVSFTTTNQYIVEPNVSVTDGPDNVGETPTITTSAFSVLGSPTRTLQAIECFPHIQHFSFQTVKLFFQFFRLYTVNLDITPLSVLVFTTNVNLTRFMLVVLNRKLVLTDVNVKLFIALTQRSIKPFV